MLGIDLHGVEPGQLRVDGAAGERLRRLAEQRVGSRPENQKVPRTAATAAALVDLTAKHPKELGHPLDLVQDHQAIGMEIEIAPRVRETRGVLGILEVEVQAVGSLRRDGAGERGLPHLARPEERHGGRLLKVL